MKKESSFVYEKIKHILYLISILILVSFSLFIFFHSINDFTLLSHLDDFINPTQLSLSILLGAAFLVSLFIFIGKLLSKRNDRKQILISAILALILFIAQYFLLFHLQPILRYDHLRILDAGLEILNTDHLSLSAYDGYFGSYPFNISAATFNSIILRIASSAGVSEKFLAFALQCVYLFLVDLGIIASWFIVKILHSTKNATLFAVLCFFNPMLYVCVLGCYTSILMLPFLMAGLLFIICMLKETDFKKKCIWAFLAAIFLGLGTRLRATVCIAGIALVIYLIIRKKSSESNTLPLKKAATLVITFALGCLLSFGGLTAYQNTFITEDYTNTQMPALYYLMFALNPDAEGSYNAEDFYMISELETLEEKNDVSVAVIKERLEDYGFSGAVSLIKTKLQKTWCDGTEDYRDFMLVIRNYGQIQSYTAGSHRDLFALYCHMYHVAIMAMFCISVIWALTRKCDSSYYLIFLTLLGGIIFYILWEAYYTYSFGFSLLLVIPASESICSASKKRFVTPISSILGIVVFVGAVFLLKPAVQQLNAHHTEHTHYAVWQDQSLGDTQPLLHGDVITQTFATDTPFNHIAIRAYNSTGASNESSYRIKLFDKDGELIDRREFGSAEVESGGYVYMRLTEDYIPDGKETFTIELTPMHATEEYHLVFGYYNTHQYDIYTDGYMTGLNSSERSDLSFMVYQTVTAGFFH